jgi:hypothetical protein
VGQPVKTQNPLNGELSHGKVPQVVHEGITEQLAYVLADLGDTSAVDAKGLEY